MDCSKSEGTVLDMFLGWFFDVFLEYGMDIFKIHQRGMSGTVTTENGQSITWVQPQDYRKKTGGLKKILFLVSKSRRRGPFTCFRLKMERK